MLQVQTLATFVPSSSMPTSPVASAIAAAPVLGRLPASTVAQSIALPETRPDGRPVVTRRNAGDNTGSAAAPSAFAAAGGSPATSGGISSFPTLFLAQLMGQNDDPATQTLVVSYETMMEFSQVKYKPSDAGKPPPHAAVNDFFNTLLAEGSDAVAANRNPAPPAAAANANTPAPAQQSAQTIEQTAPAAPPPAKRAAPAIQAYAATTLRNNTELVDTPAPKPAE